jgi:hypothetical protein
MSRIEYWELSKVSTNILVAILRVNWSTNNVWGGSDPKAFYIERQPWKREMKNVNADTKIYN